MDHASLPSLGISLFRTRSITLSALGTQGGGTLSPKGIGLFRGFQAAHPQPCQSDAQKDKMRGLGQAVIVVLPDGSLSMFDEDKELTVADVLRQNPGQVLVSEDSPRQHLSSQERLRGGTTYFMSWSQTTSPDSGRAPDATPSPSDVGLSRWSRSHTVRSQGTRAPRSLWRHNSANLDTAVPTPKARQSEPITPRNPKRNDVSSGEQPHTSGRWRGGRLERHASTDLANLAQSISETTKIKSVEAKNSRKQKSGQILRHKSASVAAFIPAVAASEPNMDTTRSLKKGLQGFTGAPAASHTSKLTRHSSTNLGSCATPSEATSSCTSCSWETAFCVCSLKEEIESSHLPQAPSGPSPRSVFPQYGYDEASCHLDFKEMVVWQARMTGIAKVETGEMDSYKTHSFEDEPLEVEFVEGTLTAAGDVEAAAEEPAFKQSKTLWRLEWADTRRKYMTDERAECKEEEDCFKAVSESPGLPSCTGAPDTGFGFRRRIKDAVQRLTRWNSVPVKDIDLP